MNKHVATVSIAPAGENRSERKERRRSERSLNTSPPLSLRELRAQRTEESGQRGLAGDWGKRDGATLWGPHRVHPAPHRASTLTMAAAYPFLTESGLGPEGTYIGTDLFGSGAFCYDPWVMYDKGFISGPSIVVIGTVGTGNPCAASPS